MILDMIKYSRAKERRKKWQFGICSIDMIILDGNFNYNIRESKFGYALLCVGFPSTDVEVETQDEDEERDDYALELAMGDE
ncbi:hypothetical protein Ahy_B01g053311 isoform B [Arachis hypogaea]|uniref:Uncharacterized protein n=1 Tax=Arachis hypogaea TaxID=3818 RepID=A0A445ARI5_ARAHY|nr:hypothetical protein Ahy_B01g053311 isoform B [Arachis hypogaea]